MSIQSRCDAALDELRRVFPRIDEAQVQRLESRLLAARRVVVAGVGREGLSTRAFGMRLMHLGLDVSWVWDEVAPSVGPGDLFVLTSGSGEIAHLHAVAGQVVAAGCELIVVTGVPGSATANLAHAVLHVPAAVFHGVGDLVPSEQPMGCLFEQALLILFDQVIVELAERMGETNASMARRHRNYE
jgi:6-phospho-3-hexuloisomerase